MSGAMGADGSGDGAPIAQSIHSIVTAGHPFADVLQHEPRINPAQMSPNPGVEAFLRNFARSCSSHISDHTAKEIDALSKLIACSKRESPDPHFRLADLPELELHGTMLLTDADHCSKIWFQRHYGHKFEKISINIDETEVNLSSLKWSYDMKHGSQTYKCLIGKSDALKQIDIECILLRKTAAGLQTKDGRLLNLDLARSPQLAKLLLESPYMLSSGYYVRVEQLPQLVQSIEQLSANKAGLHK